MKKIRLIIFMFIVVYAQAQTFTPQQVVACDGNYISRGPISVSQTIGEMAVQTLSASPIVLTQGFQQPFEHDHGVGIAKIATEGAEIKLYPNPASDKITIVVYSHQQMNYYVMVANLFGQQISIDQTVSSPVNEPHSIDVSRLASGIYILSIQSLNNKISKSILFSKN